MILIFTIFWTPHLISCFHLIVSCFVFLSDFKCGSQVRGFSDEVPKNVILTSLYSLCNNEQSCSLTDAYEPLSRIIPISKNKLTPYRAVIIMRLIVLGLFFHYRITNPVYSAFGLWMTSVICEIWFGFSWILDQFPKWYPINRETYVDRLIARFVH